MNSWNEEETLFLEELYSMGYSYSKISKELESEGFCRSKEAIRKYIKRNKYKFTEEKEVEQNLPRVLLFDIETLPIKGYFWGLFKQNIPTQAIIEDWCVLSWSAKWLYEPSIMSDILTPSEAVKRDDKRILESLWELLEECNILVGHNGDAFDVRKVNSRFLYHKIGPNTPYQTIDTLKQSRKNFAMTSHKLDYLSQMITNKEKIHTNFELWKQCDLGNKKALDQMLKYNNYDVTLLEEVYLEMLPWMKSAPNMGLYINSDKPVCGHCGSHRLEWNGYYTTPANRFRSFRCKECGGIGRSKTSTTPKETRNSLTINTAK